MKYYLPTYEECLDIVKKYDNFVFYSSIYNIDGFKIEIFNYRFAKYEDFINPLNNNISAKELRGLTFVFNSDGILFKRFILLDKFWNLNQVEETQLHLLESQKIKTVYNKEDGSIVSFIILPNGRIIPKTKIGLSNDQTKLSGSLLKSNTELRNLVKWSFDNNVTLIWELVSPFNRIVLKYKESELILLRARDNLTGKYIQLDELNVDLTGIKTPLKESYFDLYSLIEDSKILTNKEGWVVEFESGQLVKIKCDEYCELHDIITEHCTREDYIIKCVLENTIDDILSKLPVDDIELRTKIDKIINAINSYIHFHKKEFEVYYKIYSDEFNFDKKKFALSLHKSHWTFPYIMYSYDNFLDNLIKELLKKTYFLQYSRRFVEEWSNK